MKSFGLIISLCFIIASGCQSPLDIETPRNEFPKQDTVTRFDPKRSFFTLDIITDIQDVQTIVSWPYTPKTFIISLDTLDGQLRIWSDLVLDTLSSIEGVIDNTIVSIDRVLLNMRSLPAPATFNLNVIPDNEFADDFTIITLNVSYTNFLVSPPTIHTIAPAAPIKFTVEDIPLTTTKKLIAGFEVDIPVQPPNPFVTLRGELTVEF